MCRANCLRPSLLQTVQTAKPNKQNICTSLCQVAFGMHFLPSKWRQKKRLKQSRRRLRDMLNRMKSPMSTDYIIYRIWRLAHSIQQSVFPSFAGQGTLQSKIVGVIFHHVKHEIWVRLTQLCQSMIDQVPFSSSRHGNLKQSPRQCESLGRWKNWALIPSRQEWQFTFEDYSCRLSLVRPNLIATDFPSRPRQHWLGSQSKPSLCNPSTVPGGLITRYFSPSVSFTCQRILTFLLGNSGNKPGSGLGYPRGRACVIPGFLTSPLWRSCVMFLRFVFWLRLVRLAARLNRDHLGSYLVINLSGSIYDTFELQGMQRDLNEWYGVDTVEQYLKGPVCESKSKHVTFNEAGPVMDIMMSGCVLPLEVLFTP